MDPNHILPLFQAERLREIAWGRHAGWLEGLAKELNMSTPREVFDAGYEHLYKKYPIEYVLKNEFLKWLGQKYPEACIRTEQWIDGRKADVVMMGDTSVAFEIKSKYDSPRELERQIATYSKVFARVALVTQSGYTTRFYKYAPPWVGLFMLQPGGVILELKAPESYTKNLEKEVVLNLLRKPARMAFVKQFTPEARNVARKYIHQSLVIAKDMSPKELSEHVYALSMSAEPPRRHLQFAELLPSCLLAALHDYVLLVRDLKALVEIMDVPFDELHQ